MSAIFILSGFGKLMDPTHAQGLIAGLGLPLPLWLMVWGTIAIELGGGLMLLAGIYARPVAAGLAGFCVFTAVLVHYHPGDMGQMINFMKNMAMAGGLLMVTAYSPGRIALQR
jgi:putative oxidoreductase